MFIFLIISRRWCNFFTFYNAKTNRIIYSCNFINFSLQQGLSWVNPSKKLVDLAIQRWTMCNLRSDNVSVVTVMLDPPGPPRAKVLRRLHGLDSPVPKSIPLPLQPSLPEAEPATPPATSKGIAIISRFPNSKNSQEQLGTNLVAASPTPKSPESLEPALATRIIHDSSKSAPVRMLVAPNVAQASHPQPQPPRKFGDSKIQCNEVTSSDNECDTPPPVPTRPAGGHKPQNKPVAAGSKPSVPAPLSSPTRPNTRTRQQSGAAKPLPPIPEPKSVSPPPLPVKQIRRSILPGVTGYDSDAENQPQANQAAAAGAATPRSVVRNLRSGSAKKPTGAMPSLPAVTKTRQSDAATPEARVLRSRNTPASVSQTRCDIRSRTSSASAASSSATPQKLPETGVKRKRMSTEPGVPTLAAKMLKLSEHARAPSWVKPLGKRAMSRSAK